MAISIIGALAAAASAATGIYGAATSGATAKTQQQIANNNLQNTANQEQYTRALNTVALQRSTAGTTDGQGGGVSYDPATNTWNTALGPQEQAVQNASNAGSISRNTIDVNTAQSANQQAVMRALMAQRAAGPALSAIQNFKAQTPGEMEGALQQNATMANRQAEDPIIADTLRSFQRTGTAAGPVLSQMERTNADTLRKTVNEDTINAMTDTAGVNNANRSGLLNTYQTLNSAANPGLQFAPLSTQNPADVLAQEASNRAASAPNSASQGLFGTAMATNAENQAANEAIKQVPDANLGQAQVAAIGKQLPGLATSGTTAYQDIVNAISNSPNLSNNNPLSGPTNASAAGQMTPQWQSVINMNATNPFASLTSGDNSMQYTPNASNNTNFGA